jgi:RNA polymerase sigma-70 factor (ECF subfamily)
MSLPGYSVSAGDHDATAKLAIVRERSRLFLKHQRMLKAYLLSLVHDLSDAEDLLQEVGVRVLANTSSHVPEERFGAWSRGIAHNLALHHWRRARKSWRAATFDLFAEAVDRAYEEAEEEERAHRAWQERSTALRECLQSLGTEARALLEQRYVHNLSSTQIGEQSKRSPNAIRIALLRIRKALLRCMDRRGGHGVEASS